MFKVLLLSISIVTSAFALSPLETERLYAMKEQFFPQYWDETVHFESNYAYLETLKEAPFTGRIEIEHLPGASTFEKLKAELDEEIHLLIVVNSWLCSTELQEFVSEWVYKKEAIGILRISTAFLVEGEQRYSETFLRVDFAEDEVKVLTLDFDEFGEEFAGELHSPKFVKRCVKALKNS